MSEKLTVTEKKDQISVLVQALEREDGVMVRTIYFQWGRERMEDQSRRAILTDMNVEADLV